MSAPSSECICKNFENSNLQQFKVIDLGVNGKPICDFILVINSKAVSATIFEIFTVKDRKLLISPTPSLFDAPLATERH